MQVTPYFPIHEKHQVCQAVIHSIYPAVPESPNHFGLIQVPTKPGQIIRSAKNSFNKLFDQNQGTSESRVKYVGKYRYVFRVFSLVFFKSMFISTLGSFP